jgi:hypothetical protein
VDGWCRASSGLCESGVFGTQPRSGTSTSPGWLWGTTSLCRLSWQAFSLSADVRAGPSDAWGHQSSGGGAAGLGQASQVGGAGGATRRAVSAVDAHGVGQFADCAKLGNSLVRQNAQWCLEAQPGIDCNWGLCLSSAGDVGRTGYQGGGQDTASLRGSGELGSRVRGCRRADGAGAHGAVCPMPPGRHQRPRRPQGSRAILGLCLHQVPAVYGGSKDAAV